MILKYVCKKAFKLAGLEEYNYTTHSLRHTVATQLYMNDVDLLVIKEILGHSSITTTEIYTHVHKLKVKKAVENNPLSNFGLVLEEERGVAA
jgi:site-specific recombinase XerD